MEIWVKHILYTAENPKKSMKIKKYMFRSNSFGQGAFSRFTTRRPGTERCQNKVRRFSPIFSLAAHENVSGNLLKRTKPILSRDPNPRVRWSDGFKKRCFVFVRLFLFCFFSLFAAQNSNLNFFTRVSPWSTLPLRFYPFHIFHNLKIKTL